jgi:uncharacterized surface protein with fasciclin (FAS1) repeats
MVRTLKNTVLILSLIVFTACINDDYDKNYTTFEEDVIITFLQNDEGNRYSEFLEWLKISGMDNLLSAYGAYTVFAPTNEAINKYYTENNTSREQMSDVDIKELAFNHILSVKLTSVKFPQGVISSATFSEKFLNLSYGVENNLPVIRVNQRARIIALDQKVHNGVIHTVDGVIAISKIILPGLIAADPRFTLFAEALQATGMSDSLRMEDDLKYEFRWMHPNWIPPSTPLYSGISMRTPDFRKRGATAFIESDSTYRANGINNLDELKVYAKKIYDEVYPADRNVTDITDRRNSLNRFVAYHLMNRVQASNEILYEEIEYYYVDRSTIYYYAEMMCPNTLMEIINGTMINKRKDGSAIRFLTTNYEAANGLYHEIDGILTYDAGMETDVLNKRIRIDFATMFPEVITNKLRFNYTSGVDKYNIPQGYLTGLTFTENTEVYHWGSKSWNNYEGDEILLSGYYDFICRVPPIPPGTYEIRVAYEALSNRGVGQMYFDGVPCGIPLDNSILGSSSKIGWIRDSETEDNGIENDKMMHNRGYMKGLACEMNYNRTLNARDNQQSLRRIVTTKTFDKAEPHTFRFKSVEDIVRATELDFIEFMPVGQMMTEDRY